MKVLIVHCGKGIYGGAELVIVELCKYLVAKEHSVLLVSDHIHDMWNALPIGTFCNVVESDDYLKLWKRTHWWMGWADVINVHNFPATLAPFPTKKPIVWMCNEPAELFTNWWRKPIEAFNRWWVKKSGMKVVVADRFNAERFERIYKVKPTVIPYGIDYEFWSKEVNAIRTSNSFRLLQVGTISKYKNQMASIQTLLELLRDGIDVELNLIGKVTEGNYLKQLVKVIYENEVQTKVHFLHEWPREAVREFYYTNDVLLHPVKEQGGWLVPFEAICAGLPVIVSQEFTGADIIKDNGLGIVTNDYANVIKHWIVGYQQPWDEITEEARKWVKENLSWETYGEGMLNTFKEAI